MSSQTGIAPSRRARPNLRIIIAAAAAIVLLVAMALSTKVVRLDAPGSASSGGFSEAAFGAAEFPKVQAAIEKRAVAATTLAAAIAKNQDAAVKQYAVVGSAGPEFSVAFTATVGKGDFGTYPVTIAGLPKSVAVTVQTGPAILGTDLRDATGMIEFGQFTNQIEYQNAGSALNKEMKTEILSKIDTTKLAGKTIAVVGAFVLTDPANWQVTPVKLDVK